MIRTGDTLQNPVTGEELRFLETAADTDGEYVLVEARIAPNGIVAAAHVHPYQSERFEIVRGEVAPGRGGGHGRHADGLPARLGDYQQHVFRLHGHRYSLVLRTRMAARALSITRPSRKRTWMRVCKFSPSRGVRHS